MTAPVQIVCVLLPIRIVSVMNLREHWSKRSRRAAIHRTTARLALLHAAVPPKSGPVRITLTRIAPRKFDTDNLASGFKGARDGVADWLKVDDGDERLTWVYAQRTGQPKQYAAEVAVEWTA
jgi:hypothetical protein